MILRAPLRSLGNAFVEGDTRSSPQHPLASPGRTPGAVAGGIGGRESRGQRSEIGERGWAGPGCCPHHLSAPFPGMQGHGGPPALSALFLQYSLPFYLNALKQQQDGWCSVCPCIFTVHL